MDFKDRVIYARAKLNLTQAQLGRILKTSSVTINRWEMGRVRPTRKAEVAFREFCKENGVAFPEEE